jgi:Fur family peroxide stress response transcriptional regulator
MEQPVRYSRQRELIRRLLCGTETHPTAEWIYLRAKEEMPSISMGTVYRNLKLLSDNGEVQIIETSDGSAHYDGDVSSHSHFVCLSCGRVMDVCIPSADCSALESEGFKIAGQKNVIYGICPKCGK